MRPRPVRLADVLTAAADRKQVALDRYRAFIRDEFAAHQNTRARYLSEEQRWPESPFWARRRRAPAPLRPAI